MNPDPETLIACPVKVVWYDHHGVKQNWDEDFPKHAAVITSYGFLTHCDEQILVITPHLCHDCLDHSCGDMIIVRDAIESIKSIK